MTDFATYQQAALEGKLQVRMPGEKYWHAWPYRDLSMGAYLAFEFRVKEERSNET